MASFLSKSSPSAWNNSPPPSPCHPQLWPGPSGCCWPGASQLWAVKKLKRNWDESPVSTVRDVCAPQLKKSSTKKLTVSRIFEGVKSRSPGHGLKIRGVCYNEPQLYIITKCLWTRTNSLWVRNYIVLIGNVCFSEFPLDKH